tara:strand:- start:222 stop:614 length:393 start_codon:yes stop_codon:yes gene_type:complete
MGLARDCAEHVEERLSAEEIEVVLASDLERGKRALAFRDRDNGRLVLALKDSWLPVASATSLYKKMGRALKEATDYEGDPRELTKFCTSAVAYRRASRQGEATGSRLGFMPGKAAGSSIEGRRDNYSRED